jgi:hypothetical protein
MEYSLESAFRTFFGKLLRNRRDACLAQRQFGDFADAANHPHRQRSQK